MTDEIQVQIAPAFADTLRAEDLGAVVDATLRHEGATGGVTLVITDDEGIQALNRDFMGRDAPTDVLAFSAQENAGDFCTAPEMNSYLGDVIVSYPRAAAHCSQSRGARLGGSTLPAPEPGHALEQELKLLVVHGLLHLLGYDHAGEGEKAAMWARQEAILREL